MSSHWGAEPEVKLSLFQSYRQTLQAAPRGGPFYGSLGLYKPEKRKMRKKEGREEKSKAGIQVLEKTRALKNHNDGFCMLWSIN